MNCSNQSRILMQFHITGRCNLRCKHCYREDGNVEPLCFDDIVSVFEQYKHLREKYNEFYRISKRGHVNITGGEPFMRGDIKEIISYMGENREHFSYGVLSNGSFIDDKLMKLLKQTDVSFVQLSIDGDRKTHDFLRAPGDYDRVFKTAEMLEKNEIRTYISFTANKDNYKYLPLIASECRKRKITKLWSDRIVPIGNGEELKNLEITRDVLNDYLKALKKAQGGFLKKLLYPGTEVTMNRALQFMEGGNLYSCSAAKSLITVDEYGNIMPCRRMPVVCSNVFESTLSDVYFENDIFKSLRNRSYPSECDFCVYKFYCRGGALCQSYAHFQSFNRADTGCCLVNEKCVH